MVSSAFGPFGGCEQVNAGDNGFWGPLRSKTLVNLVKDVPHPLQRLEGRAFPITFITSLRPALPQYEYGTLQPY